MKKCPKCGFVLEKLSKDKKWTDFEYSEDNFFVFTMILQKTLTYLRFHELSKMDKPEIKKTMDGYRTGTRIPTDLNCKFETFRMGINISLCAILEYFHLTKIAPKGTVGIRDTYVYSKYNKARHLSAHIISDRERHKKVLSELHKLDLQSTFTQISEELLIFITNGIDKYIGMNNLQVSDLKNSSESKFLLELVNDLRRKEARKLIDFDT